jgi:hypothetical protein
MRRWENQNPAIPDPIPALGSTSLDMGDVLSAARKLLDLFF